MRHEDYKGLLALEAAGALDEGERRTLEAHLPSCAECRAELRELSDAAAALAFTVAPVAPPPRLRSLVLERVRALAPPTQAEALRMTTGQGRATTEQAGAATVRATVATEGALAAAEVAREDGAGVAGARRPSGGGEAGRGPLAPLGLGAVFGARPATGLPPAPAGRAYQLWLIADNKPLPGGTFKSEPDGRARMSGSLPPGVSKPTFAVTLEREGGEDAPKGEMYLLGTAS